MLNAARSSHLVSDLAQKLLPECDVLNRLDPLGPEPIHHSQHSPALVGLDEDDLNGVGGSAVDRADLLNRFYRIQDINRIDSTEENNKDMPCR